MSDNRDLDAFRNPSDGSPSREGQQKAGEWEKLNNFVPAPQQSWETNDAYLTRINVDQNN